MIKGRGMDAVADKHDRRRDTRRFQEVPPGEVVLAESKDLRVGITADGHLERVLAPPSVEDLELLKVTPIVSAWRHAELFELGGHVVRGKIVASRSRCGFPNKSSDRNAMWTRTISPRIPAEARAASAVETSPAADVEATAKHAITAIARMILVSRVALDIGITPLANLGASAINGYFQPPSWVSTYGWTITRCANFE